MSQEQALTTISAGGMATNVGVKTEKFNYSKAVYDTVEEARGMIAGLSMRECETILRKLERRRERYRSQIYDMDFAIRWWNMIHQQLEVWGAE